MKTRPLVGLAVAAVLLLFLFLSGAPAPFFLGGIQVNEPDHETWLTALENEGMNTVAVTVYAKQGDWDSDNLWFEETEEGVLAEMRAAEEKGLHTALVLRVALDHAFPRNEFLWHGMIMPKTEAQLDEWFRRYREFVLKWAAVAESEGVDLVAVGSEMSSLTSTVPVTELPPLLEYFLNPEKQDEKKEQILAHEDELETGDLWVRGRESYDTPEHFVDAESEANRAWAAQVVGSEDARLPRMNRRRERLRRHWVDLLHATRQVYSGPLTYAANFDQYQEVSFWEELDLVGINAYFELRDGSPVTDPGDLAAILRTSWDSVLQEIDRFRISQGVPDRRVVFTELGYTSLANCTVEPWNGFGFALDHETESLIVWGDQPEAPQERALAVRALREANAAREDDLLQGILYWKLSSVPGHKEIEPFVLILGSDDPLLPELRAFGDRGLGAPWKRFRRGAQRWIEPLLLP